MALFGKDNNGGSAMPQTTGDTVPDQLNMVGEGTVFEGTLRAESNVRVSGHIKGKLDVKGRAIITQEGVIEGELHATDADVAGSVQGELYVAERLMLKSTARIDGNIESGRIKVEEGALFSGQCRIGEQVPEKVQEQVGGKGSSGSSAASDAASASGASSSNDASKGSASGSGSPKASGTSKKKASAKK